MKVAIDIDFTRCGGVSPRLQKSIENPVLEMSNSCKLSRFFIIKLKFNLTRYKNIPNQLGLGKRVEQINAWNTEFLHFITSKVMTNLAFPLDFSFGLFWEN